MQLGCLVGDFGGFLEVGMTEMRLLAHSVAIQIKAWPCGGSSARHLQAGALVPVH